MNTSKLKAHFMQPGKRITECGKSVVETPNIKITRKIRETDCKMCVKVLDMKFN